MHIAQNTFCLALLSAFCLVSSVNATEYESELKFHVIKHGEEKHISMIPAHGYDKQGHIRENHHPNSVIYQHSTLLRNLKAEQIRMDEEAAAEALAVIEQERLKASGEQSQALSSSNTSGNFKSKGGNRALLQQLIEMERRSVRSTPE